MVNDLRRGLRAVLAANRVDPDAAQQQLRRLERTADMLPASRHVLDVRLVSDRLSGIAQASLPHDHLVLRMVGEDTGRLRS